MCGICGVISNTLNENEIAAFKDLLMVSTLRGTKGAGVISVTDAKTPMVGAIRIMGNGAQLAEHELLLGKLDKNSMAMLIGHTRSPTKGDHTLDNTHPHHVKNIYGVHNGTLWRIGATRMFEHPEANDSKLFFEYLAENGTEKAIQVVDGAYCFVWVDIKEGTLNIIKNAQRPLFMAISPNKSTQFFASEEVFLQMVLARRFANADKWEVNTIKDDTWISYALRQKKELKHYRFEELKPKPWYTTAYGGKGREDRDVSTDEWLADFTGRNSRLPGTVPAISNRRFPHLAGARGTTGKSAGTVDPNKIPGLVTVEIHDNFLYTTSIPKYELEKTLAHGCMTCGNPETLSEYDRCTFLTRHKFVCSTCVDDPELMSYLPSDY